MGRWLVPVLIAVGQVAWWPGLALLRGTGVAAAPAAVWFVFVVVSAVVLCWRRHRPIVVLVVVTGLTALPPPDEWEELRTFVPGDALLSGIVPHFVAMFSVAARCSGRTTGLLLGGVLVVTAVGLAAEDGVDPAWVAGLLFFAGWYGLIAAAGRRRGRWVRERAAAAERLAEARRAGREAGGVERRRLARELHDLTAQHLTSIVLNASAAEMLAGQRPELRAEALDFALRTGRETLDSLHRLVDVLPREDAPDLAGLADEFRQLGQQVQAELPANDPPPAVASAAYGIAREALTNTLRYAPGGWVRLRLAYLEEHAELVVEDDGGKPDAAAAVGLGGGRGVAGMRDRAQALGGKLEAGPRRAGGWRVHAVLPLAVGLPDRAASTRSGGRAWISTAFDGTLILLAVFPPLLVLTAAVLEHELALAAAVPLAVAHTAHALPLLWRRRFPWPAFAAVALTTWLLLVPIVVGWVPAESEWSPESGIVVDLVAVYSLAAWANRPALTWLGAAMAAANWGLSFAVLLYVADPSSVGPGWGENQAVSGLVSAFVGSLAAAVFFAVMLLCWLPGSLVWRRRSRRRAREEGGVETALARAAELARDERDRLAAGMRREVLQHAAEVPAAAERGDLTAVVAAARQSLAAMRALLDGLGRVAPPAPAEVPAGQAGHLGRATTR